MPKKFFEDLDKKIGSVKRGKKGKGVEEMELRLYVRDGKVLLVEPINRVNVKKIEFLENLSKERIREVIGVAIYQESPG